MPEENCWLHGTGWSLVLRETRSREPFEIVEMLHPWRRANNLAVVMSAASKRHPFVNGPFRT